MRASLVAVAGLLAVAGCSTPRPVDDGPRSCPDWVGTVGPFVTGSCAGCHGGASPAGGVDLSSYAAAASVSPDRFSAALDPATADDTHRPFVGGLDTLTTWAGACGAPHLPAVVHPAGIANPASPDFHGTFLKSLSYDFGYCQQCHGDDFAGGSSGVSCRTCHEGTNGPLGCTTCHGQPPASGAHVTHVLGARLAKPLDCSECHTKPLVTTQAGHLLDDSGRPKTEATITFGAFAGLTPSANAARVAPPRYTAGDGAQPGTCAGVYCHGDAFADTAAQNRQPTWEPAAAQVQCASCHGFPPSTHARTNCVECHPRVINADGTLASTSLHLDGKISLGDDSGTCLSCHPNPGGAHQSHLTAAHKLGLPLDCSACHVKPTSVDSPGHIDAAGPAPVFPASWTPGLAAADGATPMWNGTQCTNVYCHGGGTKLGADAATGIVRTPKWTDLGIAAQCGACHGVPPSTSPHTAAMTLTSCAACHGNTIDATGALKDPAAGGKHLNGVIDAP